MGKQKLYLGLIIGTIIGGLASLLNRDARHYAKTKLIDIKNGSSYYIKQPAKAVKHTKYTFERWNEKVSDNANSAISALEQVEDTLDQFTNNQDGEDLINQ